MSLVLAAYSVYVQQRLFVERHSWNPVHGPRELQSSDGLALRCWLATHASRRLRWTCRSVAPSTSFRVLVADVLILDGCPLVFMGLLKGTFVRVAPLTGHTWCDWPVDVFITAPDHPEDALVAGVLTDWSVNGWDLSGWLPSSAWSTEGALVMGGALSRSLDVVT